MSEPLPVEEKMIIAERVAHAMTERYGPMAAVQLAEPLALTMHILEINGNLKVGEEPDPSSVVTEAEHVVRETGHHQALATIQAICEARELMTGDHDGDIINILGVCNREIGEAGDGEH